jgi:mannose/fructose-specific phosphotransferase system component IIA
MSELSETLAPRALVAGHGDFAAGIVSAVDLITGRGGVLVPLTNRGLGADEIVRALRNAVVTAGAQVIFTDLPAGSWTIAARRVQRERPDVIVVTGANLPALLDFVFQTDSTPSIAAGHAADKGRGALVVLGGGSGSGSAD